MKKLLAWLLVAVMAVGMIIPTTAAEANEIQKGTPVLDGKLDDAYLKSASVSVSSEEMLYSWGIKPEEFTGNGTSFFLWDDQYLYICTVAYDDTPLSAGPGAGWLNDAAQHWFKEDGYLYKIHAAADGNFFLGQEGHGMTSYDFSKARSASSWTNNGWCTEIALPLNQLKVGKTFNYSLQIVNISSPDTVSGYTYGSQSTSNVFVCVGSEVSSAINIINGTPVLDGKPDDIYLKSGSLSVNGDDVYYAWGGRPDVFTGSGTVYFLWDKDYLYICTVAADTTPVSAGAGAGWMNDCSEHWFIEGGYNYKIHKAADGNFFLGADADGATGYDFSKAKSASSWTENGWCTEIALPLNDLAVGKAFQYSLQINNIADEDALSGYAMGSYSANYAFICGAETVSGVVADGADVIVGSTVVDTGISADLSKEAAAAVKDTANSVAVDNTIQETVISNTADLIENAVDEKGESITVDVEAAAQELSKLLLVGNVTAEDVKIIVVPKLDVEVTEYKESVSEENPGETVKSLTVDITPVYDVVAAAGAGSIVYGKNAVVLSSGNSLTVTEPVEISMELPKGFAAAGDILYVEHVKDDGSTYVYKGTVSKNEAGKLILTYTNPNGFSVFNITTKYAAVAETGDIGYVTLQDAVDAVANNGVIELLKDAEETVIVDREVTFRLNRNGFAVGTITAGGNMYLTEDRGLYTVVTENDAVTDFLSRMPRLFNIKLVAGNGGKVQAKDGSSSKNLLIAYGAARTISIVPNEGYRVADVKVNGISVGSVTEYCIKPAVKNYTIEAVFEEIPAE